MASENELLVGEKKPPEENDSHPREKSSAFKPKTALGRRLWSIKRKIVASGEPLLDWDEIEREVAERRGETD